MIKNCISVRSHALDPLPLSQTVLMLHCITQALSRTPSPIERDVLYGGPFQVQVGLPTTVNELMLSVYNSVTN